MMPSDDPEAHGSIAERAEMRAALAAAGTGTWHWDVTTGFVQWDATLEALCGLAPGEFGASFEAWRQTIHPDERDEVTALIQGALDERRPYRLEHRVIWPDGTVRWLECRGEVLVDDGGDPVGTVGCASDITARKLADRQQAALLAEARGAAGRLRRLQHVSKQLANALTVDDVVATVLQGLGAPTEAGVRALWMVEEATGALVLAGQSGMQPATAEAFQRIEPQTDLPGALAMRERRTVVSPSVADSRERFPDLRDIARSAQGFIAVPLIAEDAVLGVLAFGYEVPLQEADVTFLEAAAGNIAQTLKRVRLADVLAERAREVAFLAYLTRAGVTASDHRDLMGRIAAAAVPRLGDICMVYFVPEPGAPIVTVAAHADPHRARRARQLADVLAHDPAGGNGIRHMLRTGRVELWRTSSALLDAIAGPGPSRGAPHAAVDELVAELGLTSSVMAPITVDDDIIGALQVFATHDGRRHSERDLEMAEAVAGIVGDTLHQRWLTDMHRHISTTLQRAFLPPALPSVAGLDIASAYWPAGTANYVGGDFYDLFPIGAHRWALLVGDACGTGPDAAATAAIARHTARAAARHGLDHHEVLEWVNQAVQHSDRDLFCTACYATLDTGADDGTVTIAVTVGGHPLPIVVRTADATPLGTPGTLLGVFDEPRLHVERAILEPGDAVVFYTDGLTDLPPPHGRSEAELQALLATAPRTAAADVLAHLRSDLDRRVTATRRGDDTAILVIRNTGTRA